MTIYSKAPHWVRIPYTVDNLQHTMNLGLDIQDDTLGLGSYSIYDGVSATYILFDTWISAFLTEFASVLDSNNSSMGTPVLYRQLPTDATPKVLDQFQHAIAVTGIGTAQAGTQATIRYRDLEGNIIRVQIYEGMLAANQRLTYAQAPSNWQNLHAVMFTTYNVLFSAAGNINNGGFSLTTCYNNSLTRKRFSVG